MSMFDLNDEPTTDPATEALDENDEHDRRALARGRVADNDWVARYGFGVEDAFYGKGA